MKNVRSDVCRINRRLSSPVDAEENFADRWQDEEYPDREAKFRGWLQKADEDVTSALKGGGLHKIIQILGASLGQVIVKKAATSVGYDYQQQSNSDSLVVLTGSGTIVSGAGAEGSTTSVKGHTFYGDEEQNAGS